MRVIFHCRVGDVGEREGEQRKEEGGGERRERRSLPMSSHKNSD